MMRRLILILFLFLSIGFVYSADLSVELKSDKQEYFEGEEIKLTLIVNNPNNYNVFGKLSGKSTIGNSGFDISCLEFNFEKLQGVSLDVLSAQAQMSTSNTKSITSFSNCGSSQSQSTKTIVDGNIVSSGVSEEVITLNPFSLNYNFNETDYSIKSNSLDINIRKKTEEEEQQEQQEQQEKQEQQEQKTQQEEQSKNNQEQNQQNQQNQNKQNGQTQSNGQEQAKNSEKSDGESGNESEEQNEMPELPKGEELSQEKQQALKNNQQNQQSLSQLKNEISKISLNESKLSKNNLSFNNLSFNQSLELLSENEFKKLEEDKKSYFWNILGLVIFFLGLYLIYVKYFKKEDLVSENIGDFVEEIPYYLELLDLVLVQKDYKNQVKVLAQSVREFLFVDKKLKFVPTNNVGLKITQNSMFIDILKRAERIEFARSSDELDIKELIRNLKKEYMGLKKNE